MTAARTCPQPELGVVRVSGRDARRFLHAQMTQAINDLPASGRILAAWLSARGRVRALFEVVADGDTLWLILPADNCDYLVTELSRFILRADARLETAATATLPAALADIDLHRSDAAVVDAIRRGLPEVTAALRERYIPHMLNLDRLGAVSLTKGCYPGQEIVARTTNLGQVKRRLSRFALGAGERPAPGDELVAADGTSAGEINRVAATASGFELLAVVPIDAGNLRLGSDGRVLTTAAVQGPA
jgi:folate-binding protein YgfZ